MTLLARLHGFAECNQCCCTGFHGCPVVDTRVNMSSVSERCNGAPPGWRSGEIRSLRQPETGGAAGKQVHEHGCGRQPVPWIVRVPGVPREECRPGAGS